MDNLKNQVLTEKTIRLLQQNQYTFNVTLQSRKTDIKDWIEQFFNVKVKSINSHRLPIKKKKGNRTPRHSVYRKRMIITLRENYSIPFFLNE
uniref:Large ribosomal subunit protein uL23c n=1 Tax=Trichomanes speciosum TaxID=85337 RepID=A0A3T0U5W7_9MONI|nr:ribosomal protein L23 [Vandenboschia speciosa]AZZ71290.1 ribosomal protein L23 [Vandenboschia speciosa]